MNRQSSIIAFLFSLLLLVNNSVAAQCPNDTIQIANDTLSVKITSKGAEVISIFNKKDSTEYIWQGDKTTWAKHSPILFPFVGKIQNGQYKINDKHYKMKNHGFASRSRFKIVEKTSNKVVLLLRSNSKTYKIYPYRFNLFVEYTLKGNKLLISNIVENIDTQNIFFSIGGHPGFNVPFSKNEKFSDYYIEFDDKETANRIVLSKPKGYPTDKYIDNYLKGDNKLALNHELFKDRVIILKGIKSKSLTIKSKNSHSLVKIGGINKFPYLGIWTFVKKNAPFVCIEPWFGISDYHDFHGDIKEKKGIQMLKPKDSFKMEYFIQIINIK